MRTLFKNPELQAHFSRYGYIKCPIFTPEQVSELREAYYSLGIETPDGFFYTSGCSPEVKANIRAIVLPYILPVIERILINYKPLVYSYFVKRNSPQSDLYFHQDWSVVDETAGHTSINIWCPLVPTDGANGNLMVVPGTHDLPGPPRTAPCSSRPYLPYAQVYESAALPLPTQPGEAVIFDNALFHGSPANTRDEVRLAISITIIPAEAKPVLFHDTDSGKVEMCEVDEDFFIEQNPIVTRSYKVLEVRDIPTIDYRESLSNILGIEIAAT